MANKFPVEVFNVGIVKESGSGLACLVKFFDEDREEWIPYSQIEDSDSLEVGEEYSVIYVTEWIAEEKDLY